jgi:hypothetical protein
MTRLLCGLLLLLLASCASRAPLQMQRSPDEVRAEILRKLPTSVEDRPGWANDVHVALTAQDIEPSSANVCAVLAVTQQESTYTADPEVPGLAKIARDELERRAAAAHVPGFVLNAALRLDSPDGRSYAQRLEGVRTERELSELYEEFIGMVPLGRRLFAGHNPVRTGGPMQVRIDFAEQHARGYPYPVERGIRHEVFTRRGGLYFGTRHLLGYPANYDMPLYRFADFNAGWYASRNAAFQNAVGKASGIELALDGDLLMPGANLDNPGATERAVRALGGRIGMGDAQIRRALQKGGELEFEETELYGRVFALADAAAGTPVPRAVLPGTVLESPKITRRLTTAWFASRVQERWEQCMQR